MSFRLPRSALTPARSPIVALTGGVTDPTDISLSASSVYEGASIGSTVATLSSDGTAPVTYTIQADVDGKFVIDGSNLNLSAPLDYETSTSHDVTIRATNGAGSFDQAFTITVTNVVDVAPVANGVVPAQSYAQNVAINALAMSGYFTAGDEAHTYSAAGLPAGLSISSSTGDITGTPTATQVATNATITATNAAGSANQVVSVTVEEAAGETTNIAGAAVELTTVNGTPTVTLTNAGAFTGSYAYDDATLASGLPQWLQPPTLTENPAGTFTLNDDGLYLAPSDDLPIIFGRIYEDGINVATANSHTLDPANTFSLVEFAAVLNNSAGEAENRITIQEASSFAIQAIEAGAGLSGLIYTQAEGYQERAVIIFTGVMGSSINYERLFTVTRSGDAAVQFEPISGGPTAIVKATAPIYNVATTSQSNSWGRVSDEAYPISPGDKVTVIMSFEAGGNLAVYHSINGSAPYAGSTQSFAAEARFDLQNLGSISFLATASGYNPFIGQTQRLGVWTPASMPVFSNVGTYQRIYDANGDVRDVALINELLGAPLFQIEGPAADINSGVHSGSATGALSLIGSSYTDVV